MPIKDSAKKYMRVTATNTLRNRTVKGAIKSAIKKLESALATDDLGKIDDLLKACQKALDKAAQKNVIKKGNASRRKSRLNARVKKAKDAK